MKRSSGQIPIFVIIALIILTLFGIRTISSSKIWSHISSGQAMATHNALLAKGQDPFCFSTGEQKWMSTTPLYDRMMFSMADAPAAITLLHVTLAIGAFILLLPVAKKWGNSLSQSLALLLCGIMLMPMFNPSPIFFGMFFYAIFILFLRPSTQTSLRWAFLIPIEIIWANIHPTFILGPVMCLIATVEAGMKTKGKTGIPHTVKELGTLTLIIMLVTFINPAGPKLHLYLLQHAEGLMLPAIQTFISPFSAQFEQPAMRPLLTASLFLGAGGLITLKKQLPVLITTLAILSAFFMIRSLYFAVLFVYLAFPFLVLSLQSIGEAIEQSIEPLMGANRHALKKGTQCLLGFFLTCAAWGAISNSTYAKTGNASKFGLGLQEKAVPAALAQIVQHPAFPKKILNLPYDGAYLSYRFPEKQFYCDQRGDLFDAEAHKNINNALTTDGDEWNQLLSDYVPQALVLNCFSSESMHILRRFLLRKWNLCYFDGSYAILLSPSKNNASLLKLTQPKQSGLDSLAAELTTHQQSPSRFIHTTNSPQLIGAGNTFLALNRFKEALAVYSTLLNTNPTMLGAWIGYGQALLGSKEIEKGTRALEHAVSLMPNNGYALLNLQRAYQLAGHTEQADKIQQTLEKRFKPAK